MRFLLTVHQFLPDFSAGTEVLTLSVARELRFRGHEVRILTGHPSPQPLQGDARFDEYTHDGFPVYRFHHSYTPVSIQESSVALGYDNDAAADYFDRIVRSYQPDVVHFFHLNRLGTGLIKRAVDAGIPAFMSPTDFWVICPTATLMLESGDACSGPSSHAGNCIQHFATTAKVTAKSFASKIVRKFPVPVLDAVAHLTRHNFLPTYPQSVEVAAINQRLEKNVARLNLLQKIVVPTDVMYAVLERHGVAPQRIVKLAYGIDIPLGPKRDYAARDTKLLRIGFIGTLAPHKGVHVLLDAVKQMPQAAVNIAVYGNINDFPDYSGPLLQCAEQMGNVDFRGVFPNAQMAQILAGLDLLVVPSLWHENTPLVIHSALAARCPVVASNVPGISEVLVHRHNGLLFELGNAQALAKQLQDLMQEPGLLQVLSDQCKPLQSTASYVEVMLEQWTAASSMV